MVRLGNFQAIVELCRPPILLKLLGENMVSITKWSSVIDI